MRQIIETTVNWEQLGVHPRDSYRFSVERAFVKKKDRSLSVEICLNFIIPLEDAEAIEAILRERFPELSGARLEFRYEDVILEEEEIIRLYIPYLIRAAREQAKHGSQTIFPDSYIWRDGILELNVLGDSAARELNRQAAPLFRQLLQQNFGISAEIHFSNETELYEEQLAKQAVKDREELKEAQQIRSPGGSAVGGTASQQGRGGYPSGNWKSGSRASKYIPVKGNLILGKHIDEEAAEMKSLTADSGTVVVHGRVFRMEERSLSGGKILVSLLLTDGTESVCVKVFTGAEKSEDLREHLPTGTWAKVRGTMEMDRFEMVPVLMGKDIEKTESVHREDTCEKKRVELHAHTKMSNMDGINEVSALLETAAEWGQPAVAITDHGVVQAFPEAAKYKKKKKLDLKLIYGLEGYLLDDDDQAGAETIDYKSKGTNHIILLARTQEGLKNIYKLVSISHLQYFYRKPRIPRSVLQAHREGLIIGSACEAGEIFQGVLNGISEERMEELISFYDYLEIQPIVNNRFLVQQGRVADQEGLRDLNRQIVQLGKKYGKPVAATTDAHYGEPEESIFRRILMAGQGYKDAENGEGLYLRTTDEMLEEFSYLGRETALEVVIENPNRIADSIEEIQPVPSGKFPPKIDHAEETLRKDCMERAEAIYGTPLPEIVEKRLEKELQSIIGNGYAVMYVSAQMLVHKSMSDGYLVGSRGSVGSSFAATMAGITEVNPLQPHYICENPDCKHSEFVEIGEYSCGVDMPDKNCPVCGRPYKKDGFSIPFEVFLGFKGDKEPDIDLNFAGEYQPVAHKFVEEIFGRENVYRAGTISTVASKTAYGYVRKYFDERQKDVSKWEVERLTEGCTGVRRTTGQHPGGIIIVPRGHEIYEFCPIQHPANDTNTDIVTTHYEYHSIDQNLLKLDILGHDVPSMIRHLQDMTGVDPLTLPLSDPKVNSIFNGIDCLEVKDPEYPFKHGTYGIPEFGTSFVRQMLDDTKPSNFADLVRISGFSHGTNVWLNNAQKFIKEGLATMKDAISTRDDIMNYLIGKGVPSQNAFKIMENVRKGKGVTEEEAQLMTDNNVPEWYIESCRRISYMFPKAHAVAYVMMSYRIAYFKVYYPQAFYAAFYTIKVIDFNSDVVLTGAHAVKARMAEIEAKGKNATQKENDEMTVLEVACEMYARGYEFAPVSLEKSDGVRFELQDGKILPPFLALNGVGETAARGLAEEREKGPFFSVDQMKTRAGLNRTAVEAFSKAGVLEGLPETDQLTLF